MAKQNKIFTVVNRKGGVAKTTTSIHLAHGLSRKLLRPINADGQVDEELIVNIGEQAYEITGHVLLIDLDPQGNCATSLGVRPNSADISELLTGKSELADCVVSADRSEDGFIRPNLWLLPSSPRLADAKQEVIVNNFMRMINSTRNQATSLLTVLEERLGPLVDRFDYIIIDCPPTLDVFANAIYQFSDAAIVPVKLDYLSAAGAAQHVGDIRNAQVEGIEINIHTIVPTFYMNRQVLDRQILDALIESYGAKRVAEPIPKNQAVAEAPAYHGGVTLFEYAPDAPATLAYANLVERVYNG